MYSTCLFCNRDLGTNEVIETFPVGRRLAFDSEKGRLWVVCKRCGRWNLSAMEERWEAVEDAERLFRETQTRVSTDNVGLARLREGLELIRIGAPLPGEFAAWRYGDQFGRRRKKFMLYSAAAVVVGVGFVVGGMAVGVIGSAVLPQSGNLINVILSSRTRVRFRDDDGKVVKIRQSHLPHTRFFTPQQAGDWELRLGPKRKSRLFTGDDALRLAGQVMPGINESGGQASIVREAVDRIQDSGGPGGFLSEGLAGHAKEDGKRRWKEPEVGKVTSMTQSIRLALEMALHEERERRAMEGELWILEQAWREAEEIAAISDSLLLPKGAEQFVESHRAPDHEGQADRLLSRAARPGLGP